MLRLYDNHTSGNGYKVRLLLTKLGRAFEWTDLDIDAGETRTPDFLAINPDGRIPVLDFGDGRILAQSDAILWHLAVGTRFLPDDEWLRAQVLQWLFFEQYSHEPNVATPRYWATHGVEMTPARKAALPGKREAGIAALGIMDRHLSLHDWLVGEALSIADIALYAYTHVAHEGGFDLDAFPALSPWFTRIAADPGHVPITARFPSGAPS
jgi:glutathione S-transferase